MKKIFIVKRTDGVKEVGSCLMCIVACDTEEQAARVNPAFNQSMAFWYQSNPMSVDDYDFHSFLFYPKNSSRSRPLWVSDQNDVDVQYIGTADPSCVEDQLLFVQFVE